VALQAKTLYEGHGFSRATLGQRFNVDATAVMGYDEPKE
jgi:hypothetical protein